MDKNHDSRITVEEFIKVFIQAEAILKEKINNSDNYIKDYQQ